MLSQQEKQEILNDARCTKRRKAFRKALVRRPASTYDAYLKFLSRIQNIFTHAENSISKTPDARFKL